MIRRDGFTGPGNGTVGYVRRSTDKQEQSIEDQKKAISAYVAERTRISSMQTLRKSTSTRCRQPRPWHKHRLIVPKSCSEVPWVIGDWVYLDFVVKSRGSKCSNVGNEL